MNPTVNNPDRLVDKFCLFINRQGANLVILPQVTGVEIP
jgi:hypothetical protein